MAEGAIPQTLPRHINPRKLAYSETHLSGTINVSELAVVADAVQNVGEITASIAFSISDQGKILVQGKVEAQVSYLCQRCLREMPYSHLVTELSIAVVRGEEEAKQLPAALDPWIVPEDEADLYSLVSEEILLSLPVVAYHDYQCVDLKSLGAELQDNEEKRDSPFSVLSSLRKKESPKTEND